LTYPSTHTHTKPTQLKVRTEPSKLWKDDENINRNTFAWKDYVLSESKFIFAFHHFSKIIAREIDRWLLL